MRHGTGAPLCFQPRECRRNNEENIGQPCAASKRTRRTDADQNASLLKLIYELLKIKNNHKKRQVCLFFLCFRQFKRGRRWLPSVEAATFITFMFPCASVCSDRCSTESGHKQGCKTSDVCSFQRVKSESILTCYRLSYFFDIQSADNPKKLNRWVYEQTYHIPQKDLNG